MLHAAAEFQGLTLLQNTNPSEFINALHVNVGAPLLLTQACLPLLRSAPDSAVVFVMDDPQRVGRAYWGGYGVAKFALQGLVHVLADELESSSVRVSALLPGPMQTPLRARAHSCPKRRARGRWRMRMRTLAWSCCRPPVACTVAASGHLTSRH